MSGYDKISPPEDGRPIQKEGDKLAVPDDPIIPFIRGDGIGPDIWQAAEQVLSAAVQKAYQGRRKIVWFEVFAGEGAVARYGEGQWLPEDTFKAIQEFRVAIKGPLTTPIGGGIRSLNVRLRQRLDLYACVRPVRWFQGVPCPVKAPEKLDVIIFRENTEDVYAGIEWAKDTAACGKLLAFLKNEMGVAIRPDSGVGIKPISEMACKRLVRRAIQHALEHHLASVTLVHKGNIMKFTEGAFRDWGYEVAREEFRDQIVTEAELHAEHNGQVPRGRLVIKDRIADAIFQMLLLRPAEYDVLATLNLNGDYLSDASAAQVGGLGLAPGANIGDEAALFEATHGTAPKYTGMDKVNPGSLILSGVMMLEHMGWKEAGDLVVKGIEKTIIQKRVTYDLERQMEGATLLKCSEFGQAIVENM